MRRQTRCLGRWSAAAASLLVLACLLAGCQSLLKHLSDHLTHWDMLDDEALDNPLKAVGGVGTVFVPKDAGEGWTRERLLSANPQELVAYYAPIFVQQHRTGQQQLYPYPPEYDDIGTAQLRRDGDKFKALVTGEPTVYCIYQKLKIGTTDHVQLTYTAWYPAHPRMKLVDLEEADIDSCVLRVTLDTANVPLFYETIAACGCFHKVFVADRIEKSAAATFGAPEKDKKFSVERTLGDDIDWEVAGIVIEPPERPRRPVVFLKAGDHKVIGMGTAARLRLPPSNWQHPYTLADYSDLYAVPVAGTTEKAPFFDLGKGGKVWGAERKERFIFGLAGVNDAGQPRANDQIKLHFDQSTWSDVTVYQRYLRLPDGSL
jgi:hypothetical protein